MLRPTMAKLSSTVRFKCHSCSHCCTEVVCLPTPMDVIRIVKHTGKHPLEFLDFLTPEEIEDVDDDDPTWLECDDDKYMMALKRDEETGCGFLNQETRLCSIYEARPYLCRLYPFKVIEDKKGNYKGFTLHDDVGCPKHQDGEMETEPLRVLYEEDDEHQDDYIDLVQVFNERDYRSKEPEDFLNLFFSGL